MYCRCDSIDTKSDAHAIPEALQKNDHILPRGMICDSFNSIFQNSIVPTNLGQLHNSCMKIDLQIKLLLGSIEPHEVSSRLGRLKRNCTPFIIPSALC